MASFRVGRAPLAWAGRISRVTLSILVGVRMGQPPYINQLAWYDAGVRQDGYVIGFTVFTAGGYGQWATYDINDILPDLWNYVNNQH